MKEIIRFFAFLFVLILFFGFKADNSLPVKKKLVLVFSLTKGFRHDSIDEGIKALKNLGLTNNFEINATEDVSAFDESNLKKYALVVFLNPTGSDLFNDEQKNALKKYINNGGGFVGIHAATDCNYEWEWYGKMVGGYFASHPKIQTAKLDVVMPKHKIVKGLPNTWMHKDEWYNFKSFNKAVNVLVKVDETSYSGGKMNNDHPVSWYHEYDGGKVFYTALGHTKECYTDPNFLMHLLAGIKWAMK